MRQMKNIIAITACLKRCSVAISYDEAIHRINENIDTTTNLAFLLQKLIEDNNLNLRKIDGVITTSGPGSFTGIRTAQSLAKAIALTLKIPSVSINYFDIIEKLTSCKNENKLITIKADKNQIYFKRIRKNACDIGISSYENIITSANLDTNFALIGDIIDEILPYVSPYVTEYKKIIDFRDAKYLLNFTDKITNESKIQPLYINLNPPI